MHVEVLPIYAFGAQDGVSGDYYAVNGYVVAHNAKVFADDNILVHSPYNEQIRRTGWYMSQLSVGLQLLDKDGKAVDNQNVTFFVTPEPSTTIGSTTYKKGFSFSLAPSVTFGSIKKEGTEDEEPTWKKIRMGCVNFGFNWENSSTQDIPDQSVVMSTGPQDRSVSLSLLTNNVKDAIGKSAIPAIAYSDQRFDFSFVWHVDEGSYCAKKGGFGNMTMKMMVNPKYKSSYSGEFHYTPDGSDVPPENKKDASVKYYESYNKIQQELSLSETVKLPGINRIPTGYLNMKNTTRNYLTKISLWRTGEYDSNKTDAYLWCMSL